MITVKTHVPGEVAQKAVLDLIPTSKGEKTSIKVIQETGKTGYKHTHIIVWCTDRLKLQSQKKWDLFKSALGGTHFNLKPISTDKHFENCIYYDTAEKKGGEESESKVVLDEIGDWKPELPYHVQVIEFLRTAPNWFSIITSSEHSEYISNRLNWAREVYMRSRCRENFEFPSGRTLKWQQSIIDFFEHEADNRTVHWVYDEKGGHGKSDLSKWLIAKKGAFLVDCGKSADVVYAYDNHPIVIFDLCRDTKDYCPYRIMESFKNGVFFSPKYNSILKTFRPPHVIVFANYPPEVERLSDDRWDVVTLNDFELDHPLQKRKPRDLSKHFVQGVPNNVKEPPENLSEEAPDVSPPLRSSKAKGGGAQVRKVTAIKKKKKKSLKKYLKKNKYIVPNPTDVYWANHA